MSVLAECNLTKFILVTICGAIICFSLSCSANKNSSNDTSKKQSDFIGPYDIFQFAMHSLRIGMLKSEVEDHIGVGIKSTGGGYIYDMTDGTILEVVYDEKETVIAARIIADQRIKYELKY